MTRESEAKAILHLAGGDLARALDVVERQHSVLVLRTQVMLSLSGIVVTVTGFSGRSIAQVGALAKVCITSGICMVLAAAVVAMLGVMRVRWLTQTLMGADPEAIVLRGLRQRDQKGASLRTATLLFVVGFALYCIAIAQLLWRA
jgi:hypothetical protein